MAHQALIDYIAAARKKGHPDDQIKRDLITGGWKPAEVAQAISPADDLPVPPPPVDDAAPQAPVTPSTFEGPNAPAAPQAVVQTFSTRGLEYIIMFIALAVSAFALGSLLHSSVNAIFGSSTSFTDPGSDTPFAASALIVGFPIFVYLFLRLKKAELADPSLRRDPSRKRAIQLTLVLTFLVGLGNVIYFVYSLMSGTASDTSYNYNAFGSSSSDSLLGNFVHLVITLAIAGGIFYYYWRDEHQAV